LCNKITKHQVYFYYISTILNFRTIELEEKYGGKTYQTQKAKEEKKKSGNKAAIGIEALCFESKNMYVKLVLFYRPVLRIRIRDPVPVPFRPLDPGWKKVGSGINIPDPHHWFYLDSLNFQRLYFEPPWLHFEPPCLYCERPRLSVAPFLAFKSPSF
jgi:hypothetical protein